MIELLRIRIRGEQSWAVCLNLHVAVGHIFDNMLHVADADLCRQAKQGAKHDSAAFPSMLAQAASLGGTWLWQGEPPCSHLVVATWRRAAVLPHRRRKRQQEQ